MALSRTAKIIAKDMQTYGIGVKEMGGSFTIYAEHSTTANWAEWKTKESECIYMWGKVRGAKYKIETLGMRAKHLRSVGTLTGQRL